MRIIKYNNRAFSLLETLLASVIFIISIGGIFATLSAVRRPVNDKENALTAAVFGKQVLEALRSQVSASANYYNDPNCSGSAPNITCTDFSLALGTHQVNTANQPSNISSSWPSNLTGSNSCTYGATTYTSCLVYSVICEDQTYTSCNALGDDVARQVNLNINWPNST